MSGHIREFLTAYASSSPLRLHTPGHKGRLNILDITELADGSFPDAQLNAAQRDIAAAYGVRYSRLLACGSSQGVKAAAYFANTDVIVDVNSHRSVYDGVRLAGKKAIPVGRRGDVRPITKADIESALTRGVGAVILTSPTYYGFVADVDGIADFCKRRGLLFIIDGAHGAHFGFSPLLPGAFADKCDICNVSAHKTLMSLTQGAILLYNVDGDDKTRLDEAVDIMGTTSPSYLLYASIEDAVIEAKKSEKAYKALYDAVSALRAEYAFLKNDDFMRLVIDCNGDDPQKLCSALTARGVYAELVNDRYIVFLLTAADDADSVSKLGTALGACLLETK